MATDGWGMMSTTAYRFKLDQPIPATSLAVIRIGFGLMMLAGIIRFAANGWIDAQYLSTSYQFSYWGFAWVRVPPAPILYSLYALVGVAALGIALGLAYRLATWTFFIGFSYLELMDKTYYLNHYYFVSLFAFLLLFVPAHASFSLDVRLGFTKRLEHVPYWTLGLLRLQIGLLYFFAGIAKLHPEWLLEAKPLIFWLPAQSDFPLLGPLFNYTWVAYLFCWFGCLYDLTIPFLLSWNKTRVLAYASVVVFHSLTAVLFQIGLFPFVMIIATLAFFPANTQALWIERIRSHFSQSVGKRQVQGTNSYTPHQPATYIRLVLLVFFAWQLLMPFRYLAYPGPLFWTEQGYRFSWRVMLMEKTGYVTFRVIDVDGKSTFVSPNEHLSIAQEKQMATQPDMIVQFAHYLEKVYLKMGWQDPAVYADSFVALNGRLSQRFIDPTVDLTQQQDGLAAKTWILPLDKADSN